MTATVFSACTEDAQMLYFENLINGNANATLAEVNPDNSTSLTQEQSYTFIADTWSALGWSTSDLIPDFNTSFAKVSEAGLMPVENAHELISQLMN